MDKHLRFNKKCKLALLLLLSVAGMTKADVPAGAINGIFSVSENTQVYFSQGNLQYQASTNTWRFAENQYNYIGSPNTNVSSTYSGWIDLFGWGTSGYHNSSDSYNTNYYPYSTSTSVVNSTYNRYGYGPSTNMTDPNLTNTSSGYDWGVHNSIINGGNTVDTWRVLTQSEWNYVLNTRVTTSGIRYAKARVNYVNGLILLPDNWSASTYSLSNTNSSGASFNSNSISGTQWTTLENAGAVFLPAAGNRNGTSIEFVDSYCLYWSASYENSLSAYNVYCGNDDLWISGSGRCYGLSVRLVSTVSTITNPLIGAINGLFSVSASQQVYFSQGNLQYQASTNTWRFADNQYDYVGSANSNISSTYSGWIDLFGWGTSGYHDTSDLYNVNYQPWSSSTSEVNNSYNNYGYGPSTNMTDPNLTGTSGNYDWGVYNPISNGGNEANLWRTLTTTEWQYVFNTRTTTSGIRYAMAIVNGVKGIILLPDSWSNSTFSLNNTNNSSANFNSNTLTASQWSALEQAGAVFLPAAGYRYGTSSVYFAGSNCSYWSASYYDTSRAFSVIYSNSLNASANNTRYYGRSVRLVRVGSQNVSFTIDATANPAEGGEVSGMGTYQEGTECTLTATPNVGYTFVNWTKNGAVVSTNASYTFTVTEAGSYVAHFQLNSYQITASATPSAGGAVSGNGTYSHGSSCTLTATNNTGYTFVNWTKNGTVVSTNASYTFTVTEAGSYVAHFQLNSYQITASANPSAGGSVSGSGTYSHGSNCTLTASNNTGYTFVNWTKNGVSVSTNTTYSFTVTGAADLVANFTINSYTVTATAVPAEGGSVTVGVRNRDDLYYDFEDGTTQGWTLLKGAAGTSPNNWMHVTAYTQRPEYATNNYGHNSSSGWMLSESYISATSSGAGYAVTPDNYFISPQVRLGGGINFWVTDGNDDYGAEHFALLVSTTDNTSISSFTQIGEWTLLSKETGNTRTFMNGTWYEYTVDLSTYSGMGYLAIRHFDCNDQWIMGLDDITIVEGVDQSSSSGNFNYGETCTVTATPNTGYTFVNWTENGEVVSTDNPYTFTVNGAVELTANFSLNSYDITASANPAAGGTITGTGTYDHFSTCALTATANTGYSFVNWTLDGAVVSIEAEFTFEVSGAGDYVANFSLNSYEITAIANPTAGGTISGTGTYNHFSSCTLTATANTGYAFRSWNVNGETVSTDNPYTFTVSEAVELTANFDAQETTTLDNGWTWWSTSIEMSDFDGLTMLEESLGHNGLMIKSANKFVQNYYPNTGYDYWFGQLTSDDFTNASSYMIQTSASCEVTMTGTYADPSDHPIQLYPGWTWIGYPCGTEQSAASAFANFTPTTNDKVKSQYAFSTYYDNYGWFPEFTMTPGEGYLYQSLASGTRTLTFANGSKDNPQPANKEDHYWRNNIHAYADNMNIIAVVTIDGEEQQGEDLELGAFVDGECRGSAVLKHFQPTDRWYAMLTVAGTDGEQIEFGIIDKGKGLTSMTSDRNLAFQANAVVGELDEPYTIGFGTLGRVENNLMGMMHIYPNPIDRNTAFSIVIPKTETVRSIYIVNMMGEVMAHETNMTRSLAIQVPGVYTIKVVCHSDNVYVRKLIVK